MKKAIIPAIIVLVIMGAAYYYFVIRKKQAEEKTSVKGAKMPTEDELKDLGYNADEIIAIVSSESYKNGTLTNY